MLGVSFKVYYNSKYSFSFFHLIKKWEHNLWIESFSTYIFTLFPFFREWQKWNHALNYSNIYLIPLVWSVLGMKMITPEEWRCCILMPKTRLPLLWSIENCMKYKFKSKFQIRNKNSKSSHHTLWVGLISFLGLGQYFFKLECWYESYFSHLFMFGWGSKNLSFYFKKSEKKILA